MLLPVLDMRIDSLSGAREFSIKTAIPFNFFYAFKKQTDGDKLLQVGMALIFGNFRIFFLPQSNFLFI